MKTILQVAIPCPLYGHFDYLAPPDVDVSDDLIGRRVQAPFGKSVRIGMVLGVTDHTEVPEKNLKTILAFIDDKPLLPPDNLKLLTWAAQYYHHPIGNVVNAALPALLNQGRAATLPSLPGWRVTDAGREMNLDELPKQAHRQYAVLDLLQQNPPGLTSSEINSHFPNAHTTLRKLADKGWIAPFRRTQTEPVNLPTQQPLTLNDAQHDAVQTVCDNLGTFQTFLLDGVTGSGKTEVYLQIIQQVLDAGKQALVLAPEINLTPQMLGRFQQRFAAPIAVLHSRLNDSERLAAWIRARDGLAPIVIGTRSAVWAPLANPGVFIIDEEHDTSYKQQDSFAYSARDVAIVRAQRAGAPIVLGTATPAFDSLFNTLQQRYRRLHLPERAGGATPPTFHVVDMRKQSAAMDGFSKPLLNAIRETIEAKQQVLIFINRRGYAPRLMCHGCGWIMECEHCDAPMTWHETTKLLHCHHCQAQKPRPARCLSCSDSELRLMGYGTERIEQALQTHFPDARVMRVDSDSTRRKEAMATMLEKIQAGDADILVGTQMLTKGHHFPNVTLVGVFNVDGGLFGADFRASERMAQTLIQVAGRAGRAETPGRVLVQTWHPDHPLLLRLIRQGYSAFADAALSERAEAELPPHAYMALLRADAKKPENLMGFMHDARKMADHLIQPETKTSVQILGPVNAPLERRADRFRAQILLQSQHRPVLHELLKHWLPLLDTLPTAKQVKWALDVDPQDLF